MKKQLIAGLAGGAVAVAGFVTVAPYFLGIQAEKALTEQQAILARSSILSVESHRYERGWFSSTETLVVRLKPTLLSNAQQYLPDNLKTVFSEPITLVNHIKHGPFANGLTPVSAHVETEFQYQPETAKVLKRFFGDQAPVSMSNTIYLGRSGKIDTTIPAFDYEELSGIKLDWKGLSGQTDYDSGWSSYHHQLQSPGVHIQLADKGSISLDKLNITSDTRDGSHDISLGNSHVQLDRFAMEWKEGIGYDIKLNQLVNLVTDLQVGAFINPTGTIAPSKIVVDKLSFQTKMDEKEGWIDSEGRFQFAKLAYGNEQYGPLDINVAAEHLDAKALQVLKQKMAEIAGKKMSEEQIQAELVKTAKTDAVGLFTNNPKIKLNTFDFTMPTGKVQASGELSFNGLAAADLNDASQILKKTHADFRLHVPEKLLEQLAINQARNVFSVNPEDAAAGTASMDDINDTIRLMVETTVKSMQSDGYLTLTNGNIDTRVVLQQNQLTLNGKELKSEPDDLPFDEAASGEALDGKTASPASASAASQP